MKAVLFEIFPSHCEQNNNRCRGRVCSSRVFTRFDVSADNQTRRRRLLREHERRLNALSSFSSSATGVVRRRTGIGSVREKTRRRQNDGRLRPVVARDARGRARAGEAVLQDADGVSGAPVAFLRRARDVLLRGRGRRSDHGRGSAAAARDDGGRAAAAVVGRRAAVPVHGPPRPGRRAAVGGHGGRVRADVRRRGRRARMVDGGRDGRPGNASGRGLGPLGRGRDLRAALGGPAAVRAAGRGQPRARQTADGRRLSLDRRCVGFSYYRIIFSRLLSGQTRVMFLFQTRRHDIEAIAFSDRTPIPSFQNKKYAIGSKRKYER